MFDTKIASFAMCLECSVKLPVKVFRFTSVFRVCFYLLIGFFLLKFYPVMSCFNFDVW